MAASTSSADATTFIPRPPPPYAALMATGQPFAAPKARTSLASVTNVVVPGTMATPPRRAASRDDTLSPISTMAAAGGPMNATPRSVMAWAKSAFSEKNP